MLGQSLLHYQITAKLGQGGMGEVYRATDTKLDREVAIKVLPSMLAHDKERLARFEREAKVLAQLSHSHIASVHDFDEHEGTCFLVMEHVDGEDLSQCLKRGRFSIDESIDIGRQVAEGLEAAHAKGIIHRDLKPANIKLTAEGQIKVLDFGLAKAMAVNSESSSPNDNIVEEDSPTITNTFTRPGAILGTAAYMSPEQARGKALDQRTDVWAFGCVLFECLTGRRAFAGDDATDTLAAIIKGEPDWSALPPDTPSSVRHLLRKCLSKDCGGRLHEIADARIDLDIARGEVSEPSAQEHKSSAKGWRIHPALGLIGVLLLLILGIVLGRNFATETKPQQISIRKLNVQLTKEGQLALDSGNAIQLSPDGTMLAYLVLVGDERRLMLRKLDQLTAVELIEARGADQFCFSPDGQSIAFTADAMPFLMTAPISGGTTTKICEVHRPRGLDWAGGWIYIALGRGEGLSKVAETGGEPDRITTTIEGEDTHRWPHVLPGGKAILYTSQARPFKNAESKIMVLPLDGSEARLVRDGGHDARYLEAARSIVFSDGESLLAGRFNLDTLTLREEALISVIPSVATSAHAAVHVATSSDGTLFYVDGDVYGSAGMREFRWVDRDGNQEVVPIPPAYYRDKFEISSTGQHLVFERVHDEESHLWIYDLREGGEPKQFTFGTGRNQWPCWSPSGETVLYYSSALPGLVTKRRNGLGGEKALETGDNDKKFRFPYLWSLDGRSIFLGRFEENRLITGILELTGDDQVGWELVGESELKLGRGEAFSGGLSTDGRWMAYEAGQNENSRIFVESRGPQSGVWLVSVGNQKLKSPQWSPTTQELMFAAKESTSYRLYSTRFREEDGAFVSEAPIQWPSGILSDNDAYDIDPDGSRILVLRDVAQSAQPISEVICFENFETSLQHLNQELRKR